MKKSIKSAIAATVLFAVATMSAGIADRAAAKSLQVQNLFPNNLAFIGEGAQHFVSQVEKLTGGSLKMKLHTKGKIVPPYEAFDAVSAGIIDAAWDTPIYQGGLMPVAALIGSMPFGSDTDVLVAWTNQGGGAEILQRAYDKHNVKTFFCLVVPAEGGGWFNKEINTVEDFKGLKMRMPGLGAKVLTKMGASTQVIPPSELFLALERGRVDAAELGYPTLDKQIGMHRAAKYYYLPGWHQRSSWLTFTINKDVWAGLAENEQVAIEAACASTLVWSISNITQFQVPVLDEFVAGGIEIRKYSPEILSALRKTADEVMAEESAKDPLFKEAYESLTAFRQHFIRWNEMQKLPLE